MVILDSSLLIPDPGLVLWMLIVFGILVFLLGKFAWKPIMEALNEREGEIENALKMAEETRAEMAKLKSDNEKLLAEARRERDAIIAEAKEAATRVRTEAEAVAKTESNKILEDARALINHEKEVMVNEVKKEVAELSIGIAEKILRKELSDKTAQKSYIDSLIADASRLN